jgi:Carbohydrate-binding domain-containing protein Cthe_2159
LTVNANYNNGIQSKDDLKITHGNITVNTTNDGIKGKDRIVVKDGNITVKAGGDGMQSNNIEEQGKGHISIEGGTIKITAGGDGIQAQSSVIISGGNTTISSGSGSNTVNRSSSWGNRGRAYSNTGSTSISAKGIKAGTDLTINGGVINIDSSDDSLHSGNGLTIKGGKINIASGDDALRASSTIEINGGDINIIKCYEGIEGSVITINDGNVRLVSSDDGINAVSRSGGSYRGGGRGGFDGGGNNTLNINGGYTAVDAYGDGLDINGSINMTGGVLIVNGPTNNMNGPLDYSWGFNITGGLIVAAGSSGMAMAPGGTSSSTQYSVMVYFSSWQQAGTIVHVRAETGEEILTFSPSKAYSSVTLCSPKLKNGSTYLVYTGGTSTGKATDGLYSGGRYTPGEQLSSYTISSAITYAGISGGSGFSRRGRW